MRGQDSVNIVGALLQASRRDEQDAHIPLLLWWAVEAKLDTNRDAVLKMLRENLEENIVYSVIFPRVAQRLASQLTAENQDTLLVLLQQAAGEVERNVILTG